MLGFVNAKKSIIGETHDRTENAKINTIGKVAPTILLQWLQYANYIDIILAIQLGQHRE